MRPSVLNKWRAQSRPQLLGETIVSEAPLITWRLAVGVIIRKKCAHKHFPDARGSDHLAIWDERLGINVDEPGGSLRFQRDQPRCGLPQLRWHACSPEAARRSEQRTQLMLRQSMSVEITSTQEGCEARVA
jgi:hypothetical protein